MNEASAAFLAKAERALDAAETLLREGHAEFASGRAYYAMFYAAEAMLAEAGEAFRKHSGVHAAFGRRFAQGGELDPKFHRWLLDAHDARLADDYGFESALTNEDVRTMLDRAAEFLGATRSWLAAWPS
ncbi:MAG TPA: HEPN domain-containing protein [Thermoanaerobaculia bacterium]|nr:HEPN domain-containing protein [Thermoanaerobaculia bacterium]